MDRRNFLKVTGAAGTAGLAGCTSILEDNENPGYEEDTSTQQKRHGRDDTPTGTDDNTSSAGYELDFSISNVDLSDLPVRELGQMDSIRDQDYFTLEYEILRDSEPIETGQIDNLQLTFTGLAVEIYWGGGETIETWPEQENTLDLGPEIDTAYEIACTEAFNGENQVKLTAEVDGQTLEAEDTVEKILPEHYLIEPLVDGEPLNNYVTPYEFDTHDMDWDAFIEWREPIVDRMTREDVKQKAEDHNFDQYEQYGNERVKKRELIRDIGELVRDTIGIHSTLAVNQALSEEYIIQNHTDYEDEEVYAAGFRNPGGHGSKALYIDGDWYHHETLGPEVTHINNIEEIEMVGGVRDEFVSVLGEVGDAGDQNASYKGRMYALNQMYVNLSPHWAYNEPVEADDGDYLESGRSSSPFANETMALDMLNRIRDNQNRDQIFKPFDFASDINLKTGKFVGALGTVDDPVFLSTNEGLFRRIRDNGRFSETEAILDEALGQ